MTLKLVPDADDAPITDEQARAFLANIHTPKLDELRAKIPTLRTSELIGLMVTPEAIALAVDVTDIQDSTQQGIFMAASIAITAEIDRRIPMPT